MCNIYILLKRMVLFQLIFLSGFVCSLADDWRSINTTVVNLMDQHKFEEALEYSNIALKLAEKEFSANSIFYASTLNDRASINHSLEKYDDAEKDYKAAADIFKAQKGEKSIEFAQTQHNIALLYQAMKRYNEAEPYFLKAIEIYKHKKLTNSLDYSDLIYNLANLYVDMKRYEEADPLFVESSQINKSGGNADNYNATLFSRAKALIASSKFEEALVLYKEIVENNRKKFGETKPEFAHSLNNLANCYENLEQYEEALQNYTQAYQIYCDNYSNKHPLAVKIQKNLARINDKMGRYDEAKKLWEATLDGYLNQIRSFFPSMSEAEKTKFYNTISPVFEEFNSFVCKWYTKDNSLLSRMYDNQLSTKALLLNTVNKIKKRIFESGDSSLIKTYNQWLQTKELLSRFYQLSKSEREKKHINVEVFEARATKLEQELSLKSEQFSKESSKSKIKWQDIKDVLKDKEAAIEIVRFRHYQKKWTDSVYYAALIIKKGTKDNPDLILMENGNQMEREFISCYKKMIKFQIDDQDSYNQYWGRIEKNLENIDKVFLSQDGIYNQINLASLQIEGEEFLIDKANIQIVNNTKDIIDYAQSGKFEYDNQAELFGYPNYSMKDKPPQLASNSNEMVLGNSQKKLDLKTLDGFNSPKNQEQILLKDLPGTEVEVNQISNLLLNKSWKLNKHLWDNAQKDMVKSIKNPKLLHIATHGYFFNDVETPVEGEDLMKDSKVYGIEAGKLFENPFLRSGLFFAGASTALSETSDKTQSNDNGILTSYEAMNLDLDKTDLVVLSACETGLGEQRNGEGVYGLQRALQVAGAKSIIMSLWKVDDEATQDLMITFYQKWLEHGDKRLAFKEAQIAVREKYKWPYYWGAFLMIGN